MRYKKFSGPIVDFLQRWLQKVFRRYTLPIYLPTSLGLCLCMHKRWKWQQWQLNNSSFVCKRGFESGTSTGTLPKVHFSSPKKRFFGGHTCGKKIIAYSLFELDMDKGGKSWKPFCRQLLILPLIPSQTSFVNNIEASFSHRCIVPKKPFEKKVLVANSSIYH